MNKSIIILCAMLVIMATNLFAQGNLGQAGANFLQIPAEPRGAALGNAIVALTEGAPSLYWNPAGAAFTDKVDVYFGHSNWFLDTRLVYGAAVISLGQWGAIGIHAMSFYMDEMEITTVYESDGTGQFYDAGDLAAGITYARTLTDRFSFGVTAKYVHEYIWDETASQLAFDVGSMYRTDFYNLRLGMAVRNVGGKLSFSGDNIDARLEEEAERDQDNNPREERLTPDFRLPQIFQLGIAFDPISNESVSWTLLTDVDVPSDNKQRVTFGTEIAFMNIAFIRGGYRMGFDEGQFSLGAGIQLPLGGTRTRIDYAFSTRGVFGGIHQFGLGFSL